MWYIYHQSMDAKARRALAVISRCIDARRYRLIAHFRLRMAQRGMVWGDALAIIDAPSAVRSDGLDEFDRPRWIIAGKAADGLPVEFVCVLDEDDRGDLTVFITIY